MHVFKKPNFNGVRQLLTGNLTWLSCICRIEIGLADPLKGISEGQKVNSPPHSSCCTLPAIALWNTSKVWQPRHQLLIQKENFHEEIFFCQLLSYILHFLLSCCLPSYLFFPSYSSSAQKYKSPSSFANFSYCHTKRPSWCRQCSSSGKFIFKYPWLQWIWVNSTLSHCKDRLHWHQELNCHLRWFLEYCL